MNKPNKPVGRVVTKTLFSLSGLLVASTLWSQEAAEVADNEDVIELSPFTVDASDENGYRANSTLAGTRLKSSLRDVGASISVATSQFMTDIGATDLETLLTFTGGTEVPGMNGNIQAANLGENPGQVREERTNARPQANTRVRGLARADLTTNLFITDAPFDNFNIDRVTINRGANSALFGLGSPGGILDATLKRANFRDNYEVGARFDNWGSQRYTFDANISVIDDVFAVRLMGLDETIKWEQKQAYEDDSRFHADVYLKPFQNTHIRAFYTDGKIRAARPNLSPPRDFISTWQALGQPLFDPLGDRYYSSLEDYRAGNPIPREESNNIWHGQNGNPALMGGSFFTGNGGSRLTVIYPDPNSPNPGGYNGSPQGMQSRLNNRGGNADNWPGGATTQWRVPQDSRRLLEWPVGSYPGAAGLPADYVALFASPQVTDRGMFDYRENLYTTPSKLESGNIEAYNISLEQTFLDQDLGIEIAVDSQEYDDNLVKYNNWNGLYVDNNIFLANGQDNPNLGRAYVGGDGFAEPQRTSRDTFRATGYYRFDFDEKSDGWAKHLGDHTLTLNYSSSEVDFQQETHMSLTSDPAEWQAFTEGRVTNVGGLNRSPVVSYISNPLLGINNPSDYGIKGVNVIQNIPRTVSDVIAWDAARAAGIDFSPTSRDNLGPKLENMVRGTQSFTLRDHKTDPANTWTWGGRASYSEVESSVAILQSKFLDDHLITTASWRSDDVKIYDYSTTGSTGGLHSGFEDVPDTPSLDVSGEETVGISVVAHAPLRWTENLPGGMEFSAHFNNSENFVATGTRIDIFNNRLPQQQGDVTEYGFSVRALDNKIDVRVNFFESSQIGASVNPVGRPNNIWRDILNNNTPAEIAASGITMPPAGFLEAYEFALTGEVAEIVVRDMDDNETIIEIPQWNSRNPQQNAIETAVGSIDSEGMEIEIAFNPTRNWRFSINGTRAEAVRNGVAASEQEHIADRLPQWNNPNIGGVLWRSGGRQIVERDDNDNIVSIEPNYGNRIYNTQTDQLHQTVLDQLNTLNRFTVFDGLPAPELREWRWNFVTNYNFGNDAPGFLKRVGIGGALRWEDSNFTGLGVVRDENGVLVQDLSNQYFGPSNTRIDLWATYRHRFERLGLDWHMRLGVSNLNSGDGLLPVQSNPDGTTGVWRIEPPATWSITNTFSF